MAFSSLLVFWAPALGCQRADETPTGGLLVALGSELAVPKDIDHLRFEVRRFDRVVSSEERDVGPGDTLMPALFRVEPTEDAQPVTLRGIASKDGVPRIQRDATLPIPSGYVGVITLALNYLCDGTAEEDGSSTCPDDTDTCILGSCGPAEVEPGSVVEAEPSQGAPAGGACFDVEACFAGATSVTLDEDDCSIPVPDGTSQAELNVALGLPGDGAGVCDDSVCWIILDATAGGWVVDDGRLELPPGVCRPMSDAGGYSVALSTACRSKQPENPVCGAWSSATEPVESPAPPAAMGGACVGPVSRACGLCGTSTRRCKNGSWSAWSSCDGEGVCEPDSSEACADEGTRTCGGDCQWSDCSSGGCTGPGVRSCGNCGTERRVCDDAEWSDWSECADEGECAADVSETCDSGGTRTCGGDCRWSECTQTGCEIQGSCSPGQREACDGGSRTCSEACEWGPCEADGCTEPVVEACGRCGKRTFACEDGVLAQTATCEMQGECVGGETATCGNSGKRTCSDACEWSECTGQLCVGEASQACGWCGVQSRDCNNGVWSTWAACGGEGACQPNTTRACAGGGLETCTSDCEWGECVPCDGPASMACGNCGTQTRTCSSGVWSEWSECSGAGVCAPNATASCDTDAEQTCDSSCQWGACVYGHPVTLATGLSNAGHLVIDAANAYWVNGSSIMTVSLAGGTPVELATGQGGANSLAVDATNLYWTSSSGDGRVMKLALSGGSPVLLTDGNTLPGQTDSGSTGGIAVDATNVYYYTDYNRVARVPIAGGTPTQLAGLFNANFSDMVTDGTRVYWTYYGVWNAEYTARLANSGTVNSVPVGGGARKQVVARDPAGPTHLAISGGSLFFAWNNSLFSTAVDPPSTGTGTLLSASGPFNDLATDGVSVYWPSSNEIRKVPVSGGTAVTVVSAQAGTSVAVDATNVYWTTNTGLYKNTK